MGEGFTPARIVIGLLLVGLIVLDVLVLNSLHHGQQQVAKIAQRLEEVAANVAAIQERGVRSIGSNGAVAEAPEFADGKDAIGRPRRASPGFTIEPPLDKEIPGRTHARSPKFIPQMCGTYNQGEPSEVRVVNYLLTSEGTTNIIDREVHERLFTINPDDPTELWPELAVAWETSADKLTYRFHLRRGVEFSDGTPFDAEDVLFTFNAIMDPACETEHLRSTFVDVESVRALDPLTVEVRMRRLYWKALKSFGYSLRSHSKEFYEREIPNKASELGIEEFSVVPGEAGFAKVFNEFKREIPDGTGPYMWKGADSWVTNQHITLYPNMNAWLRKLNPDYYRLARMRWRIVRDQVARQEEFKAGRIDALSLDHNTWADQFSKDPLITAIADHHVYDHISLLYSQLTFNCRRFPFDDVRLRRAVAHLVDRERILKDVERGVGKIATCPTKPTYPEYSHDIVPRKFDPELARKLLAEAGWSDTDGDGLLDKDGRILEFTFSVSSARVFFKTVSTLVQEACQKVGIRCKAEPKEWSLFMEDYHNRNFDMVCLYNSAVDPWIDPFENFHSSFAGPRGGNTGGWNNPEVDRLLVAMKLEFDDAKRASMFHSFNKIFDDEVPQLLLLHGEVGLLLNKRIQGKKIRPTGLRPFDLWIDPKDAAKEQAGAPGTTEPTNAAGADSEKKK